MLDNLQVGARPAPAGLPHPRVLAPAGDWGWGRAHAAAGAESQAGCQPAGQPAGGALGNGILWVSGRRALRCCIW